ncbi:hypothetical protein [Streptomyces sp. NPDC126514]|uniref:hypothetical protein n=1 Tax=Streptomyces sp. NPDC126514 TaxID=3155210 RepID=UPI00331815F1
MRGHRITGAPPCPSPLSLVGALLAALAVLLAASPALGTPAAAAGLPGTRSADGTTGGSAAPAAPHAAATSAPPPTSPPGPAAPQPTPPATRTPSPPAPAPTLDRPSEPAPAPATASPPPPRDAPVPQAPAPAPLPGTPQGLISRTEVLQRAAQWVIEGVPYSQTSWWTNTLGTYRQDCSGYVSMAWRLDQRSNYWTGNLGTVAHPVPATDLQPGDILLSSPHTVIFAGWDDDSHQRFSLYEQPRPGHTARYTRNAAYAHYASRGFVPYRYDFIYDQRGPGPALPATWLSSALAGLPLPTPFASLPHATTAAPLPAPPLGWTDGTLSPTGWTSGPAPAAPPGPPPAAPRPQPLPVSPLTAAQTLLYLSALLRTLGGSILPAAPPQPPVGITPTAPYRPGPGGCPAGHHARARPHRIPCP